MLSRCPLLGPLTFFHHFLQFCTRHRRRFRPSRNPHFESARYSSSSRSLDIVRTCRSCVNEPVRRTHWREGERDSVFAWLAREREKTNETRKWEGERESASVRYQERERNRRVAWRGRWTQSTSDKERHITRVWGVAMETSTRTTPSLVRSSARTREVKERQSERGGNDRNRGRERTVDREAEKEARERRQYRECDGTRERENGTGTRE